MNNYEYIIASLPLIGTDSSKVGQIDADSIVADIREQLTGRDNSLVDTLCEGLAADKLGKEFYDGTDKSKNQFIREFFSYDKTVRNIRTQWINKELGRPADKDTLPSEEEPDVAVAEKVLSVLEGKDILERERGLDSLMWDKCEELTQMKVFEIDVVLSFIVKLKSIDRWMKLDPETGRAMFRQMVDKLRNDNDENKMIWQQQV